MLNLKSFFVLATLWVSVGVSANPLSQCYPSWQEKARNLGFSEDIVTGLIPSLKQLDNVLELDRKQPEFTASFSSYFTKRVSEQRISKGRELMQEHAQLLTSLTQKYGVPAQYLIAFWGLETNYGGYKGKTSTLDALATLACDPRRSEFFTTQLFDALHLIKEFELSPDAMVGSWAGAVGHTQFMPGNYRRFAVDGDGDGRIDLWNSIPDALTSAANFLNNLGWKKGERWGREVTLPQDFDYQGLIEQPKRSLVEWQRLGIKTAQGARLPSIDMYATLLLPAGHEGPAFLVYANFNVIMGWNRSQFYALSVGHLADRINGAGRLSVQPPEQRNLKISQVKQLQEALIKQGLLTGEPDGILGPMTKKSIRAFQLKAGLIPDGFPRDEVFTALGLSLEEAPALSQN